MRTRWRFLTSTSSTAAPEQDSESTAQGTAGCTPLDADGPVGVAPITAGPDLQLYNELKLPGTWPNFLITLAPLNSPVVSPVPLKATAPT